MDAPLPDAQCTFVNTKPLQTTYPTSSPHPESPHACDHPSADSSVDDQPDECPICLDEYSDDNPGQQYLCGHTYHMQCSLAWLERSTQCPMCMRPLIELTPSGSPRLSPHAAAIKNGSLPSGRPRSSSFEDLKRRIADRWKALKAKFH